MENTRTPFGSTGQKTSIAGIRRRKRSCSMAKTVDGRNDASGCHRLCAMETDLLFSMMRRAETACLICIAALDWRGRDCLSMFRCPVREALKGRIEVSTYTPLEGGLVQTRFLFTLRQAVTKGLIKSSQNLTCLYAQECFW